MANASIKAAFEQFWAHVVARLGDVIDQCKEYTDTNAVKYGEGTNVDKYTIFTSEGNGRAVRIFPDYIQIDGQDGEGVYIATDELDTGNGYIDGTPALGLYGTISDEPVRLMWLAAPVDANDAVNKEYVDTQKTRVQIIALEEDD